MNKEELSKLIKIKAEIEQIKRELETIVPEFAVDSVQASSTSFPYTQYNLKIEGRDYGSYERKTKRIRNRLNRKLEELMEEKDMLVEYICGLSDSDLRQILMYRYINGLTWGEIGISMNYGTSTIRLKHDTFLKSLAPISTLEVLY